MMTLSADLLRKKAPLEILPEINNLCLDHPDECVTMVIKALVHEGKTLLQMSQEQEERFPELVGMPDNARRQQMLNLVVAAAHFHKGHTLEIIEAAHNALASVDNLRGDFKERLDNFMVEVDRLSEGWGSLEEFWGFSRLNILDVPAEQSWVKKYESCLGVVSQDLGRCVDADDVERFALLLDNCGKRKPHRSEIVNLFYTRDDTLSPNTRELYLGYVEPQGEEVYARILNAVNNLNHSAVLMPFIAPSSYPEGFFEQQSDLIWYTIASSMGNSRTLESSKDVQRGASQEAIDYASQSMAYLLKHGGAPFAGLWAAQVSGYNLGSIGRFKDEVDLPRAIKLTISHLGSKVHVMANDGTMFASMTGSAKAFAMVKAMANHYGPEWLENHVTKDSQRALLYRASGDSRFLKNLESEKAQSQMFEADLGL